MENPMPSQRILLETPFDGLVDTKTFVDIKYDDRGNVIGIVLSLEDAMKLIKVIEKQTREIPCG
jgi:hypothetical protein